MISKGGFLTIVLLVNIIQVAWTQKKAKETRGEILYKKYDCISCHGKKGEKPFDLTVAFQKYDSLQLKYYIMKPKDFGNERMPAFGGIIREEDYPALIEYVRQLGRKRD